MINYEAKIIFEFAEKLYSKANTIIGMYSIAGVVIGFFFGYMIKGTTTSLIGGAILGALGFYIGTEKASFLKLQAQIALCQVKIEENTRK